MHTRASTASSAHAGADANGSNAPPRRTFFDDVFNVICCFVSLARSFFNLKLFFLSASFSLLVLTCFPFPIFLSFPSLPLPSSFILFSRFPFLFSYFYIYFILYFSLSFTLFPIYFLLDFFLSLYSHIRAEWPSNNSDLSTGSSSAEQGFSSRHGHEFSSP